MKKFIISLMIIIMSLFLLKDKSIIPVESIRFRVIADSDSEVDQKVKKEVKQNVEPYLLKIINSSSTISDFRENINKDINIIEEEVKTTLLYNDYNKKYNVKYGMNYFPSKNYKGITYPEGEYESLVITLGDGLGENWWCVLFPPFCLIEAEENENIEYKWKIKEILNKYF